MPKKFEALELRGVSNGFCTLCGTQWRDKPDKDLPEHEKHGLWAIVGFQALHRGSKKASFNVCNDCLCLIRLAGQDITDYHIGWLHKEKKRKDGRPRMSAIGWLLMGMAFAGEEVCELLSPDTDRRSSQEDTPGPTPTTGESSTGSNPS